jgi:TolA-binding protein
LSRYLLDFYIKEMSNKTNISHEQCLAETQMLKYIEGTMTRDEERIVDKHIAACDLCSDAIEGAMSLPTETLKSGLLRISEKIDATFVEKRLNTEGVSQTTTPNLKPIRRLKILRWVAVSAASILVLATVGIWLLTTDAPIKNTESSVVMETAPPQYSAPQTPIIDSDTTLANTTKSDVNHDMATVQQSEKPELKLPTQGKDLVSTTEYPKLDDTSELTMASTPLRSSQNTDNQAVVKESIKDIVAEERDTKQIITDLEGREQAKSKEITTYNSRTSAKAKMKTEAAPQAPPSVQKMSDENLFQTGLSYYNQQDYGNALTNFNQIKRDKTKLYEEAQWLSAQVQLKQGNKTIAKGIFETIVSEKGQFAKQAKEVLNSAFFNIKH